MHLFLVCMGLSALASEPPPEETPQVSEVTEDQDVERGKAYLEELPYLGHHAQLQATPLRFYRDPVEALDLDPLFLDKINPSEFDIPVVVNDEVIRWLTRLTGGWRKWYARWLARSTMFSPIIHGMLEEAGLPKDLLYLSMIESGFSVTARSSASAVGLWQFIAPTARTYGLRVDWWIDERRDPELSTRAAIAFLGDLYDEFGDWYLAWAGYNAGPGRVRRGISSVGSRDFYDIARGGGLPSETANYVPKLVAAAIIGKHPERYGFTGIEYEAPIDWESVSVGPSISVDVLARCAGISTVQFQEINPHLRRWALPEQPADQHVYVPQGTTEAFLAALARVPPTEKLSFRRHTVRSGETLSAISRAYGVSLSDIQQVNHVSNPNRIYVGMELVIPVAGSVSQAPIETVKTTLVTHEVNRGETVTAIAQKYRVSSSDIKRWNQLGNIHQIRVGQKLKIYTSAPQWTSYAVQRGDNLTQISRTHGCTVEEIMRWNGLTDSRIYPGQELKIQR